MPMSYDELKEAYDRVSAQHELLAAELVAIRSGDTILRDQLARTQSQLNSRIADTDAVATKYQQQYNRVRDQLEKLEARRLDERSVLEAKLKRAEDRIAELERDPAAPRSSLPV